MSLQRTDRIGNALLLLPVAYGVALVAAAAWKYQAGATAGIGRVAAQGLVGAGVCATFLALRRLRPATKAKVGLLTVSTGLSLFALEGALDWRSRWKTFKALQEEGCPALGKEYDRRTKRDVVVALRARGIPAVPTVHPFYFYQKATALRLGGKDLIPLGGVSRRTTVFCVETCDYFIFDSDEHGFNNPTGLYVPGKVDAVALGDSFTMGACIASNRNLVSRVREKYPRTINLGSGGNGPLCMLATLAEYAEPLRPKTVLWCYAEDNDLDDLAVEKQSLLRRYFEDRTFSAGLLALQPEIDRELGQIIDKEIARLPVPEVHMPDLEGDFHGSEFAPTSPAITVSGFLLLGNVRDGLAGLVRGQEPAGGEELDLFEAILRQAKERTERFGGRLCFVYLPGHGHYSRPRYHGPRYARVKEIVTGLGIPLIDVCRAFEKHGDPRGLFPFRAGGHYTEAGYAVAAEAVLEGLEGGPNR
jgi:hypothetical protein